jgi:hypothetical protein
LLKYPKFFGPKGSHRSISASSFPTKTSNENLTTKTPGRQEGQGEEWVFKIFSDRFSILPFLVPRWLKVVLEVVPKNWALPRTWAMKRRNERSNAGFFKVFKPGQVGTWFALAEEAFEFPRKIWRKK